MTANQSKNDCAWQILFQEENILETIELDGYFYISSEKINSQREARLMTKFDHQLQLPKLFQDNKLSIQPVSRGGYVIGNFSSYFRLPQDRDLPKIQYIELPEYIKTINSQHISSESSAVLCSYLSGMIDDILDEETQFTVFGRMSTGNFDYKIYNTKTNKGQTITVDKSQCEIDGGFESITKFAIIEAKCESVDDFIIRQLYYPYRLWKAKLANEKEKEVVPIFLSLSNNIFTFYVFNFSDLNNYNSIRIESVHSRSVER